MSQKRYTISAWTGKKSLFLFQATPSTSTGHFHPRYRDVNPYDHSRIVLKRQNTDTDYINANLVKLDRAKRQYILCQGPLEHTVGHFWLMIWEQQSKAILMLNKIVEKKQIKCHPYWPKGEGQKLELHDVGLTVEFLTAENYKNFSKRLFRITDMESSKAREVIQFHYTQVRMTHFPRNSVMIQTIVFSGRISVFPARQLRSCNSWNRFVILECSMRMLARRWFIAGIAYDTTLLCSMFTIVYLTLLAVLGLEDLERFA